MSLLQSAVIAACMQATVQAEPMDQRQQQLLVAGCEASQRAEVLTYCPVGSSTLVSALAALPVEACSSFFIHLPALANNKTVPRGRAAVEKIHSQGEHFHAMAEFSFGGWAKDPTVQDLSWREKGVEFRRRMVASGYNATRGDTWSLNELPSSVRHNATVRSNIVELIAGLSQGDCENCTPMPGLVYIVGMGSNTVNFSVYHPYMEHWLTDAKFWTAIQDGVRWWGQETYARPYELCVAEATLAARVQAVHDYAMHVIRLAANGPHEVSVAKAFLMRTYTPIQSAFWHAEVYATLNITGAAMRGQVALEVAAVARTWPIAEGNTGPRRIALAWNDDLIGHGDRGSQTASEVKDLAASVAESVRLAFSSKTDGPESIVCGSDGSRCACDVPGGALNPAWHDFATWNM